LVVLLSAKLLTMARFAQIATVLAAACLADARTPFIKERQVPADPTGVTTITSAAGAKITYKQPGKAGVCETTEGVDDYAGYISLNPTTNMFFWFFEAREKPSEKPLVSLAIVKGCGLRTILIILSDVVVERRTRK
jgi:hypothetical protein